MKDYTHIAKTYAQDIVDGKIGACRNVNLACQRFLDELNKEWRWTFSESHANHVCAFLENCINHTKGPLAGTLLKLEPWQVFAISNVYGWRDGDNRRFRTVLMQVSRKNGKTLFSSGLAIYELLFGGEGSEIYSVATKSDQARLCWDGAVQMINKSPLEVKNKFKTTTSAISNKDEWSFYKYLGRDSKSLDGLNPSMVIFDESAAVGDRNVFEVMESATGARDNFLHLHITTAQFSRTTAYYEKRLYLADVLSGRIDDDRWFGLLYELDDENNWVDEDYWIHSNPNLGVSLSKEFLEDEVKQAKAMKSRRNNILVKHFNIFTNSEENWLPLEEWSRCTGEVIREGDLYIGMDLSSTRDITALAYLWRNGDKFSVDFQCFLPRKIMHELPVHIKPKYEQAVRDGTLILTQPDVVDYKEVFKHVQHMASTYDLKVVGYDKWNANHIVSDMEDASIPTIDIGQGMSALSAPSKETERLIAEQLIVHSGNPFIEWMVECCSVYTDKNENIKVTKDEADKSLKIDAIIAMIMAISCAEDLEEAGEFFMAFYEFD